MCTRVSVGLQVCMCVRAYVCGFTRHSYVLSGVRAGCVRLRMRFISVCSYVSVGFRVHIDCVYGVYVGGHMCAHGCPCVWCVCRCTPRGDLVSLSGL